MGADNGATPETQRKTRVTLGYTRSHIPSITRALPNCPEGNPETHGNRIEGGSGEEGGEGGLCGIFAKNPCVYLIETQSVEGSLGEPGQDSQGGGGEEVRILAGIGEESEMEWNWFLL